MKNSIYCIMRLTVLFFFVSILFNNANATEEGDSSTVTVKGVLSVEPVCHINGDQDLDFPFGSVAVGDVEHNGTSSVSVTKNIMVSCDSTSTKQLKLTFKSSNIVSSALNNTVGTDGGTGLGVGLYLVDGTDTAIEINKPFDITDGRDISVKAVLVNANPSITLNTGTFSAVVTIETSFE